MAFRSKALIDIRSQPGNVLQPIIPIAKQPVKRQTMLPPGLQAGPASDYNSFPHDFEQDYHVVCQLGRGHFGSVHACIKKSTAISLLTRHKSDPPELYKQLRNALEAVKIGEGTALTNEVASLRRLEKVSLPSLPKIINCHPQGPNQPARWFTMPVYYGGSFKRFTQSVTTSGRQLPIGLLWHFTHQACQTLLYLHFGVRSNGSVDKDWTSSCHNDVHTGNLLLRPCEGNAYPDLVFVDFGNTMSYDQSEWDSQRWASKCQRDIEYALTSMEDLLEQLGQGAQALNEVLEGSEALGMEQCDEGKSRKFLEQAMNLAARKKEEMRQPLSIELQEYFQGKWLVSDETICKFTDRLMD